MNLDERQNFIFLTELPVMVLPVDFFFDRNDTALVNFVVTHPPPKSRVNLIVGCATGTRVSAVGVSTKILPFGFSFFVRESLQICFSLMQFSGRHASKPLSVESH